MTRIYRNYRCCPHCGNKNPDTLQDNGERRLHPDYTILCVALVPLGEEAGAGCDMAPDPDSIGRVPCGMQWCPNDADAA